MSELFGFVNIIKPTGMTSFDVVSRVKKILGEKHVGHLGTLDPAASGVLPIAVGKATKFFDYFLNKQKKYVAIAEFGVETDTGDSFGNITKVDDKVIGEKDIKSAIDKFIGEINQVPPKFSAIKIDGKKAYELARNNTVFELKPRKIKVFDINFQQKMQKNAFLFKIQCSAGTYIRTLISDIASELDTVAATPVIIRTMSGAFKIDDACTLQEFENNKNLLSIKQVFKNYKFISVEGSLASKILNGVKVKVDEFEDIDQIADDDFFLCTGDKIIGLYEKADGFVVCKVFLNVSQS